MPSTANPPSGEAAILGGRYALREPLGRGGAATVYRAVDLKLERDVAVKLFASDGVSGSEDERRQRRIREICLLARANHPNLVTLFDADWDAGDGQNGAGNGFIVMELVRGATLRQGLNNGPQPALAAQLATELGAALAYLHADGIIHRDLKPENILLASTGIDGAVTTKLVDFGIAQLLGDVQLTADHNILGTAAYLAPEQVTGSGAIPASDVYALGLVLLECLSGERSFPGGITEAAIARLTQDPPLPKELHPAWRDLLLAMTARDPARRPTAIEVAELALALPRAASVELPGSVTVEPTPRHRAEERQHDAEAAQAESLLRQRAELTALVSAAAMASVDAA